MDNTIERVQALDPADHRIFEARVAGPAALLVAKTHKIAERVETPHRLNDKDAHDMYRILVAIETEALVEGLQRLLADPISAPCTNEALAHMNELIAAGPAALISMMAGRAEEGLGDPQTVALSTSVLAKRSAHCVERQVIRRPTGNCGHSLRTRSTPHRDARVWSPRESARRPTPAVD